MRSLGQDPPEADLQDMVKEVDPDGDGTVTLSKFLTIMAHRMRDISPEDEIKEAFKRFNKSGTGLISPAELKTVLTDLGTFLCPILYVSGTYHWLSCYYSVTTFVVDFCCAQARIPRARISTT
jgi:hypothetical protein